MASRQLIILLHGIGGSGASLLPLAASWRRELPDARFSAPDAPFPHPNRTGHQWFGVDGSQLRPERIKLVRDAFDAAIRDIVRCEGFETRLDHVAFVGVSQGAIVALDAVASGRWKVGALVSFAGLLPPIAISPAASNTPVLLIHGAQDQTIPSAASVLAASQLKPAGFEVELKILPGVGHTVSIDGADIAGNFLRRNLT